LMVDVHFTPPLVTFL